MATNFLSDTERPPLLLELLYFAGWQLQIRQGPPARIGARRGGVELDVSGATLSEAAGTLFARAMRSGRAADNGART